MAKSPSYSSAMQLRFYYASAALFAILLRSVRSFYALATTNALPRRLCYLDIVNMGVLVNSLPGSNALLKFGVAILDSRTTSERFHAHVIEELQSYLRVGHSAKIVCVYLRIIMDRPRTVWPSASVLPGPYHPT